jgi:signal transduction histidine kinase
MTAGEIERLFSIDSQLRKEGTNGEKGNGLGLILCMEFIEKNNGRISVKSVKDKGTIFTFMLPKP